ncbi:hypothetical protein GE21DRAFT_1223219, partial [Neurospora crassa]
YTNVIVKNTAQIYHKGLYYIYKLQREVVSDRGLSFIINSINKLVKILNIK